MEMHVLPERRAIFTFPTNDNLYAIFVGFPIEEFPQVRADVEGSVLAALDLAPGLGPRIRASRRAERVYGHADMPNFLRKPFGPGWALVGDAGCHKDPFLALGCCDALRDAELLADAAHLGLAGAAPLDQALQAYEQQRNTATFPDYEENIRMARLLRVPADVLRLRAALRDRPEDTTRWALATHHRLPRETFFNPTNLERILSSAPLAA
jgi:flavin-dependent dehydrogenase